MLLKYKEIYSLYFKYRPDCTSSTGPTLLQVPARLSFKYWPDSTSSTGPTVFQVPARLYFKYRPDFLPARASRTVQLQTMQGKPGQMNRPLDVKFICIVSCSLFVLTQIVEKRNDQKLTNLNVIFLKKYNFFTVNWEQTGFKQKNEKI